MSAADSDNGGRKQVFDRLSQSLREDAAHGLTLWCETYAQSLLSDEVETCARLVSDPLGLPSNFEQSVNARFRPATDDLEAGHFSKALQRLTAGTGEIGESLSPAVLLARADESPQSDLRDAVVQGLSAIWLDAGGQSRSAALACFEAGKRLGWLGDAYAGLSLDLLTRANELDPSHVSTYWHLANAWFVRSFADPSAIEQALAVWTRGARIQLPDTASSWAYVVRALIDDQTARADDRKRLAAWWEGIVFLERALLLNDNDAGRWAYLGRFHRMLENEATSLHATSVSLQRDAKDASALEERAAILANTGAFDEALVSIEQRLANEPSNVWAKGVKAYILMSQGAYQAALALIEDVIAAEPDSVWNLDVRASCCRLLGNREAAGATYATVLEMGASRAEMTSEDAKTCAIAAYQLHDVDRAVALLERAFPDSTATDDTLRLLGLCRLAQGRAVSAEELLLRGITRGNMRELDELLSLELPDFESSYARELEVPGVLPTIARVRRTAAALVADLKRNTGADARNEAEAELALLLHADHSPGVQPSVDIAVRAGLARLQLEGGRWLAAASTYESLLRVPALFPEASIGIERAVAGVRKAASGHLEQHQYAEAAELLRGLLDLDSVASDPSTGALTLEGIGDALWAAGKAEEALRQFEQALVLAAGPAHASRRAELHSRVALVHHQLGDAARVRASVQEALRLYKVAGAQNPWLALANACRPLIRNVEHFWQADALWADLASNTSHDEAATHEIARARESAFAYLDDVYRLAARTQGVPVVTPIALEVGTMIVPFVDPKMDEGTFIYKAIPAMRQRIQDASGLPWMPGLRVRSDPTRNEAYVILLDGAPVASGEVKVGFRYRPARAAGPNAIASSDDGAVQARDPVSGGAGAWLPSQLWETLAASGGELYSETQFILRHIEHVLCLNLDRFLGIHEAGLLVESLEKTEPAFVAAYLRDPDARLRFARGMRALVREGVPLTDWPAIVAGLSQSRMNAVETIVRQTRFSVKAQLPGNQDGTTLIQVPDEWETFAPRGDGGSVRVNVSPVDAHRLLSALRRALQARTGPLALVASARLRPIVRRLIEYEFPEVSVLAREEVLHPDLVQPFDGPGAIGDAHGSFS